MDGDVTHQVLTLPKISHIGRRRYSSAAILLLGGNHFGACVWLHYGPDPLAPFVVYASWGAALTITVERSANAHLPQMFAPRKQTRLT